MNNFIWKMLIAFQGFSCCSNEKSVLETLNNAEGVNKDENLLVTDHCEVSESNSQEGTLAGFESPTSFFS